MFQVENQSDRIFRVVINSASQYSLWPDDYEIPLGWRDTGKSGFIAECLDYMQKEERGLPLPDFDHTGANMN
ncbi:MAG: MbtH family protein [Desulfobacteraceae bacterium]|nr:MAG: MbtH family protein [Desulfobacteraceae bacterium]